MRVLLVAALAALLCASPARASGSGSASTETDAFVGDSLGFDALSGVSVGSVIASTADGEGGVTDGAGVLVGHASARSASAADSGSLSAADNETVVAPAALTSVAHLTELVASSGAGSAVKDAEAGVEAPKEAPLLFTMRLFATESTASPDASESASSSGASDSAGVSTSGSSSASYDVATISIAAGSGSDANAGVVGDHVAATGSQANSSASGSGADSPNVGDEPYPTPTHLSTPAPTETPTPTTTAPAAAVAASGSASASGSLATREAQAKAAQEASGATNSSFGVAAAVVGAMGCAAVIAVAVFVKRRGSDGEDGSDGSSSSTAPVNRESASLSVYNDPLGTRFSSIVMITPNGDGVCIL